MKWTKKIPDKPKPGTTYWTRHFAFLPKDFASFDLFSGRLISKTTVWLGFYYTKHYYYKDAHSGYEIWVSSTFTSDDQEYKDYLMSKTPLMKAMRE